MGRGVRYRGRGQARERRHTNHTGDCDGEHAEEAMDQPAKGDYTAVGLDDKSGVEQTERYSRLEYVLMDSAPRDLVARREGAPR